MSLRTANVSECQLRKGEYNLGQEELSCTHTHKVLVCMQFVDVEGNILGIIICYYFLKAESVCS